jgi:broad specificity phosphatase PhoE
LIVSAAPRTYFFLRHAEAVHQARAFRPDAIAPGTDWPLTPQGERQARAAARVVVGIGAERVISSGLRRARETAEHIAAMAALPYEHAWPELDEISPRLMRSDTSARERPEWWEGVLGAWHLHRRIRGAPEGPLDVGWVEDRIREVLARLDELPERRVAVVGHGYWILLMALTVPGRFRMRWITNCSVTRVEAYGGGDYRLACFAKPITRVRAHA